MIRSGHAPTLTTSWDDGDVHALRMADLLDRFGLKGTFYVSRVCPAGERLSEAALRRLSDRHEIGAHTLRHVRLDWITQAQARDEIFGSRDWLEDVLGRGVRAFCYPWGKWSPRVLDIVAEAGFSFGRTIEHLAPHPPRHPLLHGTTTQTVVHPYYLPRILRRAWDCPRTVASFARWDAFMDSMAALAASRGAPFHLWGHTWEVDAAGQWERLEGLFGRLTAGPFRAVVNSELVGIDRAAAGVDGAAAHPVPAGIDRAAANIDRAAANIDRAAANIDRAAANIDRAAAGGTLPSVVGV